MGYRLDDILKFDDKNMQVIMHFRGNIESKEAGAGIQHVKSLKLTPFVDWSPCGFRYDIHEEMPAS